MMLTLDLSRCMLGGFDSFTPTNNATLVLFNNGQGAEALIVWSAYAALFNVNTCGFGLFQGNPGGTVQPSAPLWTRQPARAGVVSKLDTATNYQLYQFFHLGMSVSSTTQVNIPWAIVEPGWSFIIQDQKAGDIFGANVIWQAALIPEGGK